MRDDAATDQAGKAVLLVHAGIADSRMWEPQVGVLRAAGFRVIAPDLRGFGERRLEPEPYSHVRDLEDLLDGPTAVVGNSLGGRVALELAVLHPKLVDRLVLIAPGLPGWNWSAETREGWAEEEAAFERGDRRGAAEASVRMWVVGPSRSPEAVDSEVREAARSMILRSYEMQQAWDEAVEKALDPPVSERLGEIDRPTLVIVGDEDIADMQAIAAHVAASITGAQLVRVPRAAHLPSLERPEEVNTVLLGFLGGA